jgi:acetyl esterase/lipase
MYNDKLNLRALALVIFPVALLAATRDAAEPAIQRPGPTHADVRYGPHERNTLDLWLARSVPPTPLIVFIHGGGYTTGSKAGADSRMIARCLGAGVSFMSINYRFRDQAPIQDIVRDGARSIQFMRANAKRYNIDPRRIAVYGSSAGAGMTQWLAFHDDIADPASPDPVLRESSRILAAGVINGQATLNRHRWPELIGPRDPAWLRAGDDDTLYGMPPVGDLSSPSFQAVLRDVDTLQHVSQDDPPVFLHTHRHPDGPPQNRNHYVHHPNHPRAVKRVCDAVGVPATLSFERTEPKLAGDYHVALFDFFSRHLQIGRSGAGGGTHRDK